MMMVSTSFSDKPQLLVFTSHWRFGLLQNVAERYKSNRIIIPFRRLLVSSSAALRRSFDEADDNTALVFASHSARLLDKSL